MYSLEDTEEAKGESDKGKEGSEGESDGKKEGSRAVHLHLDGPASLFRISERYGNSFAKIFPALLKSKGWRLRAGILHKGYQGKRILEFTLDDSEEAFKATPEAALTPEVLSPEIQIKEEKGEYQAGTEEIKAEEAAYDSKLEQ